MSYYLKKNDYKDDDGSEIANKYRVLESAAKMIADNPKALGLSEDEWANYLFQYFELVEKTHGKDALDQLKHITTPARHVKEDYYNAKGKGSGNEADRGGMGGVQGGGKGSLEGTSSEAKPDGGASSTDRRTDGGLQEKVDPLFNREQTKKPEFKNWFGDWEDPNAFSSKREEGKPPVSMAVNKDGTPKVLYHSTSGDFNQFEVGRGSFNSNVLGSYETNRHGIFLAESPEFANEFVIDPESPNSKPKTGGKTIPVYLNIKSPLDLRSGKSTLDEDTLDDFKAHGVNPRWITNGTQHTWELFDDEDGKEFVRAAKEMGYDGAIITDDSQGDAKNTDTWVAFEPEQIKSAIGNSGSFDPNDPNILRNREKSDYEQTKIPTETGYRSMVDTGSIGIVDLTKDDYELVNKLSGVKIESNGRNLDSQNAYVLVQKLISHSLGLSGKEQNKAIEIASHILQAANDNGDAGVPILTVDPNRRPEEQKELEKHEAMVHAGQRVVSGDGDPLTLFPKSVTDDLAKRMIAQKAWYALKHYGNDRALLAAESEAFGLSGKFNRLGLFTEDEVDELMWESLKAQTSHHGEKLNTIDPTGKKYVDALREAAERHESNRRSRDLVQLEFPGYEEGGGQEKEVPSPSGTPEGGGVEGDQGDSGAGSEGVGAGGKGESESGILEDRITPSAAGQESSLESNTSEIGDGGKSQSTVDRGSTGTTPTTVEVPGLGKVRFDENNTMYFAYLGDTNIATASLSDDGSYLVSVHVEAPYRRKGVSTALYDFIERHIGHPLKPSPRYQSEDAKKFWGNRGGAAVIPIKGNTVLAAAPIQIPPVPVVRAVARVLPRQEIMAMAEGMNPNPQRQVSSVRELMKLAKSRMIP
jgi:hypothetical protein